MFLCTCWFTAHVKLSATSCFVPTFSRPYFLFRDRVVQVSVLDSDVVHSSTSRTHCICLGDWWVWLENVVGNFVILTKNFLNLCCFHQRWYHSVVFSSSRAETHTSLCSTRRSDRASSVPEHDSVSALSCFHATSPVTVARGCELIVPSFAGCRFELPDAGFVCSPCSAWRVSDAPSECLLNSFLKQAPPQIVEHLVAFLQQSSRPVTRRNSPCPATQGAAPRSPSLCLSLGTRRAHRIELFHVHVLESLVKVSTRRDESVSVLCRDIWQPEESHSYRSPTPVRHSEHCLAT